MKFIEPGIPSSNEIRTDLQFVVEDIMSFLNKEIKAGQVLKSFDKLPVYRRKEILICFSHLFDNLTVPITIEEKSFSKEKEEFWAHKFIKHFQENM